MTAKIMFYITAASILFCVQDGISAENAGAAPADKLSGIDDDSIYTRFEKELILLMENKASISGADMAVRRAPLFYPVSLPAAVYTPLSFADIYRKRRSGVLIFGSLHKCGKCNKWHLTTASGFVLTAEGLAITNYHVVEKLDNSVLGAMTADGQVLPVIEVLAADKANDVAMLRLKGKSFTPLALAADTAAGSPVSVISHPNKMFYTMTEGIISRYFYASSMKGKRLRMGITAEFAKGSSGAPVFNAQGNVVGIVTSTRSIYYNMRNGHAENLQMVVNTCIPAAAITALTRKP